MRKITHTASKPPNIVKRVRFMTDGDPSYDDGGLFSPVSPPFPPQMSLPIISESPTSSTPSLSPQSPGFDTPLPQVSPPSSDTPLTPSPVHPPMALPETKDEITSPPLYRTVTAILAFSNITKLKWDVSLPPANAHMHNATLSNVALDYSATLSHNETMTLMVSLLPGMTIPVFPSSGQTSYVTVRDVLHAIYRFFRQPLSETELEQLNPSWRDGVDEAYRARYRRFSDNIKVYEEEKLKGPKKIDLLLGRVRWVGIRPAAEDGLWDLHLS